MRVAECISMIPLLDLVIFSKFFIVIRETRCFHINVCFTFLTNLWVVIKYISKYLVVTDGRCVV